MKINAISAIASVVVAGAAIYGFASGNVLESQASTTSDTEMSKSTCDYSKEATGNHTTASADGMDSKVCDATEELMLMDEVDQKEDCGTCPSMKDELTEEEMMFMDAEDEACEGGVCPMSEKN